MINLKPSVATSSPVISNTLITQKSNIKPIQNNCNINNVNNCDKKATITDVKKYKASIAELQSISEQACHLTNELVCCRQELIQLRKKIKDQEIDHHFDEVNLINDKDNHLFKDKDNHLIKDKDNHLINDKDNHLINDKDKECDKINQPVLENNIINHQLNGIKNKDDNLPHNCVDINEIRLKQDKDLETIRRLSLELKEAQSNYDFLEIAYERLTKKVIETEKVHESDLNLMKDRINDLTSKLITTERLLRLAKQKIAKHESRQERRRSSLKGKT